MSTRVIAGSRTRRVGVILLVVVLGLLLCFLWKSKHFIRMILVENPETCVLCDEFARDVPCLLDIKNGLVGELVGDQAPGRFQYIGTLSAPGSWNSDSQTGHISIPEEPTTLTVPYFCRSCRWTIVGNPSANFYLTDLSDPADPVLYPIEEGTLTLLGWTITTEQTDKGFNVTID